MNGILEFPSYSAVFSGHETFPLRQMWLKKVFEQQTSEGCVEKGVFSDEIAISRFGVGKNMVSSIRHWAVACRILEDPKDTRQPYVITPYAAAIFAEDGLDPYSEDPATAWFVHWCLAGEGHRATTWFWLFNRVSAPSFTREDIQLPLMSFAQARGQRLSASTLARDIETCLRSYSPKSDSASLEDLAEPMLGELGIVHEDKKGVFTFRRGHKATLSDGMFAFALTNYWRRIAQHEASMSFESIAYGDGSPGRVFKLSEEAVAEKLFALASLTNERLVWDDTAGLRQVIRRTDNFKTLELSMLRKAYA